MCTPLQLDLCLAKKSRINWSKGECLCNFAVLRRLWRWIASPSIWSLVLWKNCRRPSAKVPWPRALHQTWDLKHSEAARQTNTNKAQGLNRAHSPPMVLPELWFIHVYLWLHPRRGRQGKSKIQAFVYLQCSSEAKSVKQLRQLGCARGWHDDLHDAIGEGSTCHLRATNPSLSSAG